MNDIDNLIDESLLSTSPRQPAEAGFSSEGIDLAHLTQQPATTSVDSLIIPPNAESQNNLIPAQNVPPMASNLPVVATSLDQSLIPPPSDNLIPQDPFLQEVAQDGEAPQSDWRDLDVLQNLEGSLQQGFGGLAQSLGEITPGSVLVGMKDMFLSDSYDWVNAEIESGFTRDEFAKLPVDKKRDLFFAAQERRKTAEAQGVDSFFGLDPSYPEENNLTQAGIVMSIRGKRKQMLAAGDGELSFLQNVVMSSTNSIGQALPGLVAAYATRGRSLGMNFTAAAALPTATASGSAYDEARNSGASVQTAQSHAIFTGVTEQVLEKLGYAPLEKLTEPAIKTIAKTIAAESGTEMATTLIQEIESAAVLNKDLNAKELTYQMLVAGVSGAATSAVMSGPIVALQKRDYNNMETTADELAEAGIARQDLIEKVGDSSFQFPDKNSFINKDFASNTYYDASDANLTDISSPEARTLLAQRAMDAGLMQRNEAESMIADEAVVSEFLPQLSPLMQEEHSAGYRGAQGLTILDESQIKPLSRDHVVQKAQEKYKAFIEDTANNIMTMLPEEYQANVASRQRIEDKIVKATPANMEALNSSAQFIMGTTPTYNHPFKMKIHPHADKSVLPEERTNQAGVTVLPHLDGTTSDHLKEADSAYLRAYKSFFKKYMPDVEIYVTTDTNRGTDMDGNPEPNRNAEGSMRKLGENAYLVIVKEARNKKQLKGSTLMHEFGHVFHEHYLEQQSQEMQQAILSEILMIRSLYQSAPDKLGKLVKKGSAAEVYFLKASEIFARAVEGTLPGKKADFAALKRYGLDYKQAMDDLNQKLGMPARPASEMLSDVLDHAAKTAQFKRIVDKLKAEYSLNPKKRMVNWKGIGNGSLSGVINDLPSELKSDLPPDTAFHLDHFGKRHAMLVNLTQIIANNSHIPEMGMIGELAREMQRKTNGIQISANARVSEWRSLGKAQSDALSKFLYDYTTKYKTKPDERVMRILADLYKLDAKTFRIANSIIGDMDAVLNEMEKQVIAQNNKIHDPVARQEAIDATVESFAAMRTKPYFPLTRFGRETVTMYAREKVTIDGRTYQPNQVVRFSTYETKREGDAGYAEAQKQFKGNIRTGKVRLQRSVLSEEEQVFLNMPPHFVKSVAQKMDLSPEQQGKLSELLNDMSPAQSFAKHFNKKHNLSGYSEDAMRTYADYMARYSRHVARLEYSDQLLEQINNLSERSIMAARNYPQLDTRKRQEMVNYLRRWHNYLMNPENEFAQLRSFGFFYYLGYNPKSALLNLSQLGLTAYPALAAKHGDAAAIKALGKGMRDSIGKWKRGELDPDAQRALDWGIEAGFLDESDAAVLSGAANGNLLSRGMARTKTGRAMDAIFRHSSDMFHITETFGRRTTFLAAYELARQKGLPDAEARIDARSVVDSTMFEYARWARPEMLRGKKSAFFLFHQFSLNMTRFAFGGDPGWWRSLLVLGAVAGLQGLPFAENLMDVFDWLYKKAFGTHSDVRTEARKYIQEAGANPDLIMHGAGRYTTGLFNEMSGLSLPYFDLSGSLSMGEPFPILTGATDALTGQKSLSKAMADSSGALVSLPFMMHDAIVSETPDKMTKVGKLLPKFMNGGWNAAIAASRGGLPDKHGDTIIPYDLENMAHVGELIGMSAGFQPTRKSQAYELLIAQNKAARYWQLRRTQLISSFDFALRTNDKESLADVRKAIVKFNQDQPFGGFTIHEQTLRESIKNGRLKEAMREAGLSAQERLIPLYLETLQQYPQLKYQAGSEND